MLGFNMLEVRMSSVLQAICAAFTWKSIKIWPAWNFEKNHELQILSRYVWALQVNLYSTILRAFCVIRSPPRKTSLSLLVPNLVVEALPVVTSTKKHREGEKENPKVRPSALRAAFSCGKAKHFFHSLLTCSITLQKGWHLHTESVPISYQFLYQLTPVAEVCTKEKSFRKYYWALWIISRMPCISQVLYEFISTYEVVG